jgi:hypothetical protein
VIGCEKGRISPDNGPDRRIFLDAHDGIPPAAQELSRLCGTARDGVRRINNLINELSVHSEFLHPSRLNAGSHVRYSKIASIAADERQNRRGHIRRRRRRQHPRHVCRRLLAHCRRRNRQYPVACRNSTAAAGNYIQAKIGVIICFYCNPFIFDSRSIYLF